MAWRPPLSTGLPVSEVDKCEYVQACEEVQGKLITFPLK